MSDKNGSSSNVIGVLGLAVSLVIGAFTLYKDYKTDLNLDRLFQDFLETFLEPSVVLSYFSWVIFLIIYGVLNLFEKVHEKTPEKNKDTLQSKNFYYDLYWWGIASLFFHQVSLTAQKSDLSLIFNMIPPEYIAINYIFFVIFMYWGLHHVVAGRVFINGYWDPHIHHFEGYEIVDSGIYDHVRHPIYGGQILFTIAITVVSNNIYLLILPLATVFANVRRANREEKVLDHCTKGQYEKYKSLTPSYMFCAPKWSRLIDAGTN